MWFRPGRVLVVSLRDGSYVRGVARWSWSRRNLRLAGASVEDDKIPGLVVIPVSSVLLVQDVGTGGE